MPYFFMKAKENRPKSSAISSGTWPWAFLFLEVVAVRLNSVLQKRVATRSVKKGFGDSQQASASEEKWTEMPCLPSSAYLKLDFHLLFFQIPKRFPWTSLRLFGIMHTVDLRLDETCA